MNENLDPQQRQNSTSGENFYTIMEDCTIVTKKLDFNHFGVNFIIEIVNLVFLKNLECFVSHINKKLPQKIS